MEVLVASEGIFGVMHIAELVVYTIDKINHIIIGYPQTISVRWWILLFFFDSI
jgi:hypothetical protein